MHAPAPPHVPHAMPELAAALRAADLAGRRAMEIYADGPVEISTKADDSPVTRADIACHEIISRELASTRHAVLSEESAGGEADLGDGYAWIVDPLDGTADFIERTGQFTVMIALVHGGRPVIGVIVQPAASRVFAAQDGMGAYALDSGSWRRIHVASGVELARCRAVCSRNHLSDADVRVMSRLGITNQSGVGSSLKACMIACGEADVYVATTTKMKMWDTCASWCIVSEAGGRMTDAFGQDLEYNSGSVSHDGGIVASVGGRIHEDVVRECRAAMRA